MRTNVLTIAHALEYAAARLKMIEENPLFVAELFLAHALNQSRAHVKAWPERAIESSIWVRYQELIERRVSGEPVAYITGSREFWSMQLVVTSDTLIPRPDTERLVELALERLPNDALTQAADLGTGSGAIALALARERPRAVVIATDRMDAALAVAQANATRLGLHNVQFRTGEWCVAIQGELFDLIVSNPPYIAASDPHLNAGDLRYEPRDALSAGEDALRDLRCIIRNAHDCLRPGGWLLVEHGSEQQAAVIALYVEEKYTDVTGYLDYAGHARVVAGRRA